MCVIFRIVLISSISCIDYSCIAKFKGISAAFQDRTDLKSELLLLLHNSSAKKSSNYVEFTFILSWMWFFFLVFTNIMKNHGIKTNAISWLPFMLCSIEIVWWTKEKVSSSIRETTLFFFCFIFGKLKKKSFIPSAVFNPLTFVKHVGTYWKTFTNIVPSSFIVLIDCAATQCQSKMKNDS